MSHKVPSPDVWLHLALFPWTKILPPLTLSSKSFSSYCLFSPVSAQADISVWTSLPSKLRLNKEAKKKKKSAFCAFSNFVKDWKEWGICRVKLLCRPSQPLSVTHMHTHIHHIYSLPLEQPASSSPFLCGRGHSLVLLKLGLLKVLASVVSSLAKHFSHSRWKKIWQIQLWGIQYDCNFRSCSFWKQEVYSCKRLIGQSFSSGLTYYGSICLCRILILRLF